MKRTTLVIDERCYAELKRTAAREGRTVSEVVDEYLRLGLRRASLARRGPRPRKLPSFRMGSPRVDVADRDQLERAMQR